MKLRMKMLLLAVGMLAGLACFVGFSLVLVDQVRVGGAMYQTISDYKGLLEQLALLKSDLNQVRGEILTLIMERDQDKIEQNRTNLGYLYGDVNDRFEALLSLNISEDKRISLEDAQTTWQEFSSSIETEVTPLVLGEDYTAALEISNGVQRMRYERFSEQISGMVDILADSVREVLDLSLDQIEPAPRIGTHLNTEFIKGMGNLDNRFVIILDINRVFSSDELALVQGLAETDEV